MRFEFQRQLLGASGDTRSCLVAVDAILGSGTLPESVTIVTHVENRRSTPMQEEHLFLFWHWPTNWTVTIVPSGFASGYSGEGPRGFSLAICLIKSKSIPTKGIDVSKSMFTLIDSGKINYQILEEISLHSEPIGFPYPGWVIPQHEELLEKEQLWRVCNWRESQPDWMGYCMARIDEYHPSVGEKLRLALSQQNGATQPEQYQQIGILLRDSWIELAQKLTEGLRSTDISPNHVKSMLRQIKLSDQVIRSAESVFDLALKIQHDRNVKGVVARTCLINTVSTMDMILELVIEQ